LFLDFSEKNIIPQNNKNIFIIESSSNFRFSLEIKIHPFEEVDVLNLFLIIKSFADNLIYQTGDFFIKIENPDDPFFIVFNKSTT
jgi:hypothetical protein